MSAAARTGKRHICASASGEVYFKVLDTYVAWPETPAWSFGVDVNYVTNEVIKADEGLFGGIAQVLHELIATAGYTLADGFLVRGGFRRDWSNARFFTEPRPGDRREQQTPALVGLVW